jgi:hypothetical protein
VLSLHCIRSFKLIGYQTCYPISTCNNTYTSFSLWVGLGLQYSLDGRRSAARNLVHHQLLASRPQLSSFGSINYQISIEIRHYLFRIWNYCLQITTSWQQIIRMNNTSYLVIVLYCIVLYSLCCFYVWYQRNAEWTISTRCFGIHHR